MAKNDEGTDHTATIVALVINVVAVSVPGSFLPWGCTGDSVAAKSFASASFSLSSAFFLGSFMPLSWLGAIST
eukprot:CAMPEP_0197720888 /NCGR_PEP_ID=MMETSP1434-20131217/4121_1 /TAXON_ID=265543 /ORGANISM="Minutocellus polymorphus, Strain CCMP3303" /LENGTH=72 /DNA_ID=CAMNT_0043305819 /DNA_START=83 /DNA_END=301 /DNA_ORIENTATION=+